MTLTAGISDPVVDALMNEVIAADTRPKLVFAARALDRVIRAGRYWVPQWYANSHRLAYWNVFGHPVALPKYIGVGAPDLWRNDMSAYIARRILLMFPTLLGILFVSFVVVQFAPGGLSAVAYDVIPYGMLNGNPGILGGLNVVGMSRAGIERSVIHVVRRAYKQIFEGEGSIRANAA
eukprot:gene40645-54959_t